MTSSELRKWLEVYYGRGQRLAFVADYNAAASAIGDEPITLDGLENWLYRHPPQGRRFEQMLDMVLTWREHSKPVAKVYTITLPVSAERQQLIKEIAGDGEHAPEGFLRFLLNSALDNEIERHQAAARRLRGNGRRGRPSKPTLVRPEGE